MRSGSFAQAPTRDPYAYLSAQTTKEPRLTSPVPGNDDDFRGQKWTNNKNKNKNNNNNKNNKKEPKPYEYNYYHQQSYITLGDHVAPINSDQLLKQSLPLLKV